jgi:hypothetical protein
VLQTGAQPTQYPVLFCANFNLPKGERQFIRVLTFAEDGATSSLERDNLVISAAVGGWFGGWTTISPIPLKDCPGRITLEAFAPSVYTSQARLTIWVDETVGRKLRASLA